MSDCITEYAKYYVPPYGEIKFNYVWAMPSKLTFTIKPIKEFIEQYNNSGVWIDPFANQTRMATITNDLNEAYDTDYHMDAVEFLTKFDNSSIDGVLFDPPYSYEQCIRKYDHYGKGTLWKDNYINKAKDEILRILKHGGRVLTFGWNSAGMGKKRNFKKTEILLVCHGPRRYDTICLSEIKL